MAKIFQFVSRGARQVENNLVSFIALCRDQLTVFGEDLPWHQSDWKQAKLAFGTIDKRTRVMTPECEMKAPFVDFAKAYVRYQQGHSPTKMRWEMFALRALDRAMANTGGLVSVTRVNGEVLDRAALLARDRYQAGAAYHAGRELERLAVFLTDNQLVHGALDWKNPNRRPDSSVRTGIEARKRREKLLPNEQVLDAIAEIFFRNPSDERSRFVTSVVAMLCCAPSRISEILSLPEDCEITETKRDGSMAYGWRFMPGKGGDPFIKWIPEPMVSVAREAIRRVREMTAQGRVLAKWLETNPNEIYAHAGVPVVDPNQKLTRAEVAAALGLQASDDHKLRGMLRDRGLSALNFGHSLGELNEWVHEQQPKDWPLLDKERGIRFSNALFCLRRHQIHSEFATNTMVLERPTVAMVNNGLASRMQDGAVIAQSVFDRHGYNRGDQAPLRASTKQFRHLLNTMAQRGGLSQEQIARWSGRADIRQNRSYDHMTEHELLALVREHDPALVLAGSVKELAEQVVRHDPVSQHDIHAVALPSAHLTDFGFCLHDFVMSPCQRFRDCLNCSEQICIKGDRRVRMIRERYEKTRQLVAAVEKEAAEEAYGADRWLEVHKLTEQRLASLLAILESDEVPEGTVIRLNNALEFSPMRRALEARGLKPAPGGIAEPSKAKTALAGP